MTFLNKHKSVAQFENGIRTGLSNASYSEQFDRPAFTDQQKAKESELPQPTNNDAGFEESEAWFMPPSGIDWGFDSPVFDDGVPNPSSPWNIIFHAWTNDCFVKGEATPIEIRGTYEITGSTVMEPSTASLTGGLRHYVITVPESDPGFVPIDVAMITPINVPSVPSGIRGLSRAIVYECTDDACADCLTETPIIGYTSQQMALDADQNLTISDRGAIPADCFTWAIASGGGTLSDASGYTTTLTAPSSNAECAENATIELSCNGVLVNSLEIAYSSITDKGFEEVVTPCAPSGTYSARCYYTNGTCNGIVAAPSGAYHQWTEATQAEAMADCVAFGCGGSAGDFIDTRSGAQITAGCCPYQLF